MLATTNKAVGRVRPRTRLKFTSDLFQPLHHDIRDPL
jgi:hypothetical protein